MNIPLYLAKVGEWLTEDYDFIWFEASPLTLFTVGGFALVLVIVGVHVVRLFVGG